MNSCLIAFFKLLELLAGFELYFNSQNNIQDVFEEVSGKTTHSHWVFGFPFGCYIFFSYFFVACLDMRWMYIYIYIYLYDEIASVFCTVNMIWPRRHLTVKPVVPTQTGIVQYIPTEALRLDYILSCNFMSNIKRQVLHYILFV